MINLCYYVISTVRIRFSLDIVKRKILTGLEKTSCDDGDIVMGTGLESWEYLVMDLRRYFGVLIAVN